MRGRELILGVQRDQEAGIDLELMSVKLIENDGTYLHHRSGADDGRGLIEDVVHTACLVQLAQPGCLVYGPELEGRTGFAQLIAL